MKRLQLLDYGRFAAAFSILLYHYTFNGFRNGKISSVGPFDYITYVTHFGKIGVEFFFIISGYVIYYSAQNKTSGEFVFSRVKRLYPAFWFAVLFTSLFAFLWGKGTAMEVSVPQIFANLTMLPEFLGYKNVDGAYWTLVYELKFYLLIFLILFFGIKKYLNQIIILWTAYLTVSYFLRLNLPYSDIKFSFFTAGLLFAYSRKVLTPLIIVSLIQCYLLNTIWLIKDTAMPIRPLLSIITITGFYFFFFYLNTKKGSSLSLYKASLLGGLSYIIYLIHGHFGYLFLSKFATENNKTVIYFTVVFLVIAASYLIHFFIEKKLSDFWTTLFKNYVEHPVSFLEKKLAMVKNRIIK